MKRQAKLACLLQSSAPRSAAAFDTISCSAKRGSVCFYERRGEKVKKNKTGTAIILLFIPVLVYSLFFVYPIGYTVYLSFMKWNGMAGVRKVFVGFQNYRTLFSQAVFRHSLGNAVVFMAVSLLVIFPISFLLALLVSKGTKINSFLRTAYYIPTLLPMAATGMMWMFMLAYNGGAVNEILGFFGFPPHDWLGDTRGAIWVVALVNAWMYIGSNMLIFVTGITNVPSDILEAAIVDGADPLQRIIHITIPNMKETFKVFLTSAIAGSIKVFDIIYVMTDGGPGTATDVPATLMYDQAFLSGRFGYASSIGGFIIFLSLLITFALNFFLDEKEESGRGTEKLQRRGKL